MTLSELCLQRIRTVFYRTDFSASLPSTHISHSLTKALYLFLDDLQLFFKSVSRRPLAPADWGVRPAIVSLEHLLSLVQVIAPLLVCIMAPRCRCLSCWSGHSQDQAQLRYPILWLKNELTDYSRGVCFRANQDTATYLS